jgi:hypothetical protein
MNFRFLRLTCSLILLLGSPFPAAAYVLEGESWTLDRTVVMQLSLGGNRTLSDGFTSFNQSAQDALGIWNNYLAHLRFSSVFASPVVAQEDDDEMSAIFSDNAFGEKFDSSTLALTLLSYRNDPSGSGKVIMEETDTVFNTAFTWDSYRGALRNGVQDFHRVAIHEFGHTLGLDHPDEHNQTVVAIMNSAESNTDTAQPDDIAGVQSLYSSGPAYQNAVNASALLNVSTRALVGAGDNVLIGGFIIQGSQPATVIMRGIGGSLAAAGIASPLFDPTITIKDSNNVTVTSSDDWFTDSDASTIASYHLDPPNSIESATYITLNPGAYTAIVQSYSDSSQPAQSGIGLVELYDLHLTSSRLGNISTRGQVQTGDNVLIGGFIVGGSQTKQVVVRALGPTLGDRGVNGYLTNPTLELHDASGNLIASNDDWASDPNAASIQAAGLAPAHNSESALESTLSPGSYTAIVRGANSTSGIGLVEVYDLSPAPQ